MLEKLHVDGLPFIVGADETVPDPSYGDEGQLAFKPSTGQWWVKSGGAWVPTVGLVALGYGGSSATSLAIGTGSKVFTTQSGLAYNGARVRAASAANLNNFMEGPATYSGTTLTMTCDLVGGSGTHADWLFSIAGQTVAPRDRPGRQGQPGQLGRPGRLARAARAPATSPGRQAPLPIASRCSTAPPAPSSRTAAAPLHRYRAATRCATTCRRASPPASRRRAAAISACSRKITSSTAR